ncbi:porin [Labrys neptuniae]
MRKRDLVLATMTAALFQISHAHAAGLPICHDFGDDFFLLPGTSTCLQIAGEVRADYVVRGGKAYASSDDRTEFETGAAVDFDARTKTEWGVLRSLVSLNGDHGSQDRKDDDGPGIDAAFLQWGGLTAGYTYSYFGSFSERDAVDLLAYTAAFGEGITGTIALEYAEKREAAIVQLEEDDKAEGIGGQRLPDLVANLRFEESGAAAVLEGALHLNRTTLPGTGTALGYALGTSFSLDQPDDGRGYFSTEAIYANGASSYTTSDVGLFRDSLSAPPDAYLGQDGRLRNVASWVINGEIGMDLTEDLSAGFFGSYLNVGKAAIDTVGMAEYRTGSIGANLDYAVADDFSLGAEITWSRETIPASAADDVAGRGIDSWVAGMHVSRSF